MDKPDCHQSVIALPDVSPEEKLVLQRIVSAKVKILRDRYKESITLLNPPDKLRAYYHFKIWSRLQMNGSTKYFRLAYSLGRPKKNLPPFERAVFDEVWKQITHEVRTILSAMPISNANVGA